MKSCTELPEGYRQILHLDLQKDTKKMLLVNGLAIFIMAVMIGIAACFVPLISLFVVEDVAQLAPKLLVMALGTFVYIVLHEAVHGIVMRCFCKAKVKFGFTGMYAFAGSQGYYCRWHYIIIALAPIVVFAVIFGVINAFVPITWFYVVYFLQVMNISGAAGDLYVTWKMSRLPRDILVQDTGVSMTVYSREGGE